ncbi:MAG TPA: hypothetical protein VFK30_00725, partial [Anaerolineae bacterium]|nr:hypothetical protein [Anaerolineae bacterium]
GAWSWVQVGSFSVPQMNKLDRIISLLSGELWLGLALIALLIGSFTMHFELWRMGKIILGSAFMLLLIAAWIYWLVLPSYYGDDLVFSFVTLALTVATIFFGRRRFGLLKLVLVIGWLALAIWGASAALGRPYYGTSFKAAFGIVLVVITLAIGWRLRRRSSNSSVLSMIALIVFSALAEAWALWIWQISQQWPYYSGVSLYVELTVFFTVATIGLTLLTLLRRQALGRAWLFSLWGGRLLLGIALVTQFGYLMTDVIEAIVLVALTIGSIGLAHRKNVFGDVTQIIVIVGWLEWLAALIVIKPALPTSGFLNLVVALPMIVIPIVFVGLWCVAKFYQAVRANGFKLWFIIAAGALLYGLPFVLWTQGAIPFYDSALWYAIAFALAVLIAGKQYLKRQTIDVQPIAGEGQAKI